jgi:hypothetical protein
VRIRTRSEYNQTSELDNQDQLSEFDEIQYMIEEAQLLTQRNYHYCCSTSKQQSNLI